MPRPKSGPLCATCHGALRAPGSCYCHACKRARELAWHARRKAGQPQSRPRLRHELEYCNCNDPRCTGVTCRYVRVSA